MNLNSNSIQTKFYSTILHQLVKLNECSNLICIRVQYMQNLYQFTYRYIHNILYVSHFFYIYFNMFTENINNIFFILCKKYIFYILILNI